MIRRYLCDTNVVSELIKPPDRWHPTFYAWARRIAPYQLVLSAISAAESWAGKKTKNEERALRAWAEAKRRFVGVDYETAMVWGLARARAAANVTWPPNDSWHAAIACRHDFVVATRNVDDFRHFDCEVVNPWDDQPG